MAQVRIRPYAALAASHLLTSMPFVRIGKLRAIGISTAKRSPQVPLLPSIAESGLPGFDVKAWYGVLAPTGLPKSLLARLNAEIQTLALPDMHARFVPQGIDLASSTSEHFAELIESEVVRWRKIVNDAGAVPELIPQRRYSARARCRYHLRPRRAHYTNEKTPPCESGSHTSAREWGGSPQPAGVIRVAGVRFEGQALAAV